MDDDDGDNKDHIEDEEDGDQYVAVVQTQSLKPSYSLNVCFRDFT